MNIGMKNIYSKIQTLFLFLMCMGIFSSCEDIFDDLSKNPNQQDVNGFYSTPENINKGVIGIYGYISTPRNLGASGIVTMISRGDETSSVSDYGVPGEYSVRFTPSFYTVVEPFQLMYTAAAQACQMVEIIPSVDFSDEQRKNAYLGEAYFLRAFAHFYLFLNYRNIPLIKQLPKSPNEYKPQATPQESWDFIISDLINAKQLLPKAGYWESKYKGRVTSGSAAALLGMAYLYRSGIERNYGGSTETYYNEAAEVLGEIINKKHGEYKLVDDYSWNFDVAHENNEESLFEIQFLGDIVNTDFNPGLASSGLFNDFRGLMPPIPAGGSANSSGPQVAHDWLYNKFVASVDANGNTDPRMFGTLVFDDKATEISPRNGYEVILLNDKNWEETYGEKGLGAVNDQAGKYKCANRKWLDWTLPEKDPGNKNYFFYQRAQGVNWRFIRYSDVLLMYAEAVVSGGKQAGITPLEAINIVRDRVKMPHVSVADMNTIENERILELSCEGHRFYDLLRWGRLENRFTELTQSDPNFKQFNRSDYVGFKANKNEWLPIPIDEIEANPYIKENNPGW